MIATLSFFEQLQVAVQRLLRFPRGSVDALQAGVALVAPPVGGRAASELEGRDVFGGGDVRAAAQVTPNPFAGTGIQVVVGGQLVTTDLHDVGIARFVVDELEFVGLVGKLAAGLILRFVDAPVEQLPLFDDLAHPLFQLVQVFGRERVGDVEVVVEAVGDRRPDSEFGCREQILDSLGQHVCGRVPDDTAPVVGVSRHRDDIDVGVGNPAQVAQFAVGVAHHHDRVGRPASRQARVAHRGRRGRPGRHPDRGCWGGVCEGGHRRGLHGFRVFKGTRPCYRDDYCRGFSLRAGPV